MIYIAGSDTAAHSDEADDDQSSLDESYGSNQSEQDEDQVQNYN
jgi:hypothetical protein